MSDVASAVRLGLDSIIGEFSSPVTIHDPRASAAMISRAHGLREKLDLRRKPTNIHF
jgi:hypothetical protein